MKLPHLLLILGFAFLAFPLNGQTLAECQAAAKARYPLLQRRALIAQTTELTLDRIDKGWLPQIQASAQATLQSETVNFPAVLTGMMAQQGYRLKGMRADQYRMGVDISQTLYEGGRMAQQKKVAEGQGAVLLAQNDVALYAIRRRVNALYFGILLVEEKLSLNAELQRLLAANEARLAAMVEGGTAAESDWRSVQAERLTAVRQATEWDGQRTALRRMLALFTGLAPDSLSRPEPLVPPMENRRPELSLYDRQIDLTHRQERALDAQLRPQLSAFASGYYGYPGYDMYRAMMDRKWTLHGMIGLKLSWNINALYNRRNDLRHLANRRAELLNGRDTFLFNNALEEAQKEDEIQKFRRLLCNDDAIIPLRTAVREAMESKLRNGIAQTADLVRELHNEHAAKLQRSVHELQLLQAMYDRQFTTND